MKIGTPLDKPLVPSGTGKAAPKDPLGSRGTAVDGTMTSAGASATENTKVSLSTAALAASTGSSVSGDFDAAKVAAFQQGAHTTYLDPTSSQIGHKESAADTARVLSGMFVAVHSYGSSRAALAVGGALGALTAVGAVFLGILAHGTGLA